MRALAILTLLAGLAYALPVDEVNRVMRASAAEFRKCYQRELNRDPSAAPGGKLVLRIKIGKQGEVVTASFGPESTLANTRIRACVLDVAKQLRFPAKNEITTITYPLLFSSGG